LALGMFLGVFVVFYVAGFGGVDGVVTSHATVIAGEPVCTALAEDDITWDDILFCRKTIISTLFCEVDPM
jgi:hypothetical protein